MNAHLLRQSLRITLVFGFLVIALGAATRLHDAGLGCPDWPGCYGYLMVPSAQQVNPYYPTHPLDRKKAHLEMIHRYCAAFFGLAIMLLTAMMYHYQKETKTSKVTSILLFIAVFIQAILGMWTVTLKLYPTIVMLHLLGAFSVIALLWWQYLHVTREKLHSTLLPNQIRYLANVSAFLVIVQIMLGGWTSANYAATVCPEFQFCAPDHFAFHSLGQAFNLFPPLGENFSGGKLDHSSRILIQMIHRGNGLLTFTIVICLAWSILRLRPHEHLTNNAYLLLILVSLQVILGFSNVIWMQPLVVAISHNTVAAMLLLGCLSVVYFAKSPTLEKTHVKF